MEPKVLKVSALDPVQESYFQKIEQRAQSIGSEKLEASSLDRLTGVAQRLYVAMDNGPVRAKIEKLAASSETAQNLLADLNFIKVNGGDLSNEAGESARMQFLYDARTLLEADKSLAKDVYVESARIVAREEIGIAREKAKELIEPAVQKAKANGAEGLTGALATLQNGEIVKELTYRQNRINESSQEMEKETRENGRQTDKYSYSESSYDHARANFISIVDQVGQSFGLDKQQRADLLKATEKQYAPTPEKQGQGREAADFGKLQASLPKLGSAGVGRSVV